MEPGKNFNLCKAAWIPISTGKRISLIEAFSASHGFLSGSPIQKIAIFKLLLAIGQAVYTPKDEKDWAALTLKGFQKRCVDYLQKWEDRFDLYGEKPFLQMSVSKAKVRPFESFDPEKASGNTTLLTQIQSGRDLTDAEKAVMLIQTLSFALGGKKADKAVLLDTNYTGKGGRPGPSLGAFGYLHSFALLEGLAESVWLNLLTAEDIREMKIYPDGVGQAPWEEMPATEDCPVARRLKKSLIGRLVPMSRYCLLTPNGMHYTEGVAHLTPKDGVYDPSMTVKLGTKDLKPILVNPLKRPWRSLTAILSFMASGSIVKDRRDTRQLAVAIRRVTRMPTAYREITIWSGGVRVSFNAGEQFLTGSDDYVESAFGIAPDALTEVWFLRFVNEMDKLDGQAKSLYGAVKGYFEDLKVKGDARADLAVRQLWMDAEADFQRLVDACGQGEEALEEIRRRNQQRFMTVFSSACPHGTPRQLLAWTKQLNKRSRKNDR